MINEEKIDLLIQIQGLSSTVSEGIKYLIEHTGNEQMKADILAGIDALKAHLDRECPNSVNDRIWQSLKVTLLTQPINCISLSTSAQQLSSAVTQAVTSGLAVIIKEDTYITESAAKKIFTFYDQIPHMSVDIYQLLFDTCAKSSLSAPLQSFQHTLKLFEEQPAILSGKNMSHPGYVYRPSEQRTFDRCPICNGEGMPYYRALSYNMSDFVYPDLPVKLWMKCNSCGNLYSYKFPEGYLAQSKEQRVIVPDSDRARLTAAQANGSSLSLWGDVLNKLRKYTNGNSLLEVGVGQGELVAVALEMEYEVDAVEINAASAQTVSNMLNISVFAANFLEFKPNKTYSNIIMGDVIEHVAAPETALRNAYQLLDDNGVLWLSTPNFCSSFSRMMKFNDPMWMEPHHVTYFYGGGLRTLVEKCGFTVKEYSVSRRYNGSMELILTKNPMWNQGKELS